MNYLINITKAIELAIANNDRLDLIADGYKGFQQYSLVAANGNGDAINLYCCPECDTLNEDDDVCEHCDYGIREEEEEEWEE